MYTVPLSFIGGVGGTELVVLFVVILVLFGPKRLPEIARMIGRTLDELRNASQDFKDQVMQIKDESVHDVTEILVPSESDRDDAEEGNGDDKGGVVDDSL